MPVAPLAQVAPVVAAPPTELNQLPRVVTGCISHDYSSHEAQSAHGTGSSS
jgi:hypothetical protein